MVRFTVTTAAVFFLIGLVISRLAPPASAKTYVCGQIFIVGNETTPGFLIRDCLTFTPGKRFTREDLEQSQQNLLRYFNVEKASDDGPTVRLMGHDSETVQDIVVVVREDS